MLNIAKYFYPNDRKLDFVFQNLLQVRAHNFNTDLYPLETLITASDPMRDAQGKLVNYKAGAVFQLPETYVDEDRGVVITRDQWTRDALYLNFECHPDTHFASHEHADRGRFVFAALGRNWAWQDSRPHETAQANSVLIDGVGQGFFPTYGRWLGYTDNKDTTLASYAYDWKWQKEAGMWPDDDSRFTAPFYASLRDNAKHLDPAITESDPLPQIVAYYKPYIVGNPRFWDEDSWVVRQANNPVRYAFREAGLVRGAHPYALITDDIKKDDATHTYKWLMQLEEDPYIAHQEHTGNVRDIVLAEKNGDRLLLLRVLDQDAGEPAAFTEHYPTEYKLQGNPLSQPTMYRLTVPSMIVAYHSRVVLYPLRKGEPLPAIQWDAGTGNAQLSGAALHDELDFTASADGRTKTRILRDGQTISQTK